MSPQLAVVVLVRCRGSRPIRVPQGRELTAAMAFELASTNLVVELSVILIVLIGWQFMLAEAVGAPIMVALLVALFRRFLHPNLVNEAEAQADRGISGRMEGHAEMDMSVTEEGSLWRRASSENGLTAISHYFVMDWAAVWPDIVGGLLIAGALAAWVPHQFWQWFFLVDHPLLATIWGPPPRVRLGRPRDGRSNQTGICLNHAALSRDHRKYSDAAVKRR